MIVFGGLYALLVGAHWQLSGPAPSGLIWACYLFGALAARRAAALLALQDRERSTWTLSDTALIGGVRQPVQIALASISAMFEACRAAPWLHKIIHGARMAWFCKSQTVSYWR